MDALSARLAGLSVSSPATDVIACVQAAADAPAEELAVLSPASVSALCDLLPVPLTHDSAAHAAAVFRLSAELAKHDTGRRKLSSQTLISRMVSCLSSDTCAGELAIEACRALGNLCYENDTARTILLENSGSGAVGGAVKLSLLRSGTQDTSGTMLRKVSSGLLLNFINDHPAGIEWAVSSGIVREVISAAYAFTKSSAAEDESAFVHHVLVVAGVVCESEYCTALLDTEMARLLAESLKPHQHAAVIAEALDLCGSACRQDAGKLALAQAGVCESLCQLLAAGERPADGEPEPRALLVEILSGDEAMTALYRRGAGDVYQTAVQWLKEMKDEDLAVTACHALGNFATNDDHAQLMVRAGVHEHLLTALTSTSRQLQLAALGALRNLCVPAANKAAMLQHRVLDKLLDMRASLDLQTPTAFKFFGTLRLLVEGDGGACCRLAENSELLVQLVAAALSDGPYGVHHEASRLLARVVSTAKSAAVTAALAAAGAHAPLVRLLRSDNARMANEALLALCFTTAQTSSEQLIRSEIASAMAEVLEHADFPQPVRENAWTLLHLLRSRDDAALRDHLSRIPESNGVPIPED